MQAQQGFLAPSDQATILECVAYSSASFAPHLLPACTGSVPVSTGEGVCAFQVNNMRQHLQLKPLQHQLWESSLVGSGVLTVTPRCGDVQREESCAYEHGCGTNTGTACSGVQ